MNSIVIWTPQSGIEQNLNQVLESQPEVLLFRGLIDQQYGPDIRARLEPGSCHHARIAATVPQQDTTGFIGMVGSVIIGLLASMIIPEKSIQLEGLTVKDLNQEK